ncbi:MAG TPA: hypothetical protein VGZ47_19330 [Gemmataceae bacterium]|jgi:hypothetical protein|nr:hypothetical protein [Gemmataceae bacterium]
MNSFLVLSTTLALLPAQPIPAGATVHLIVQPMAAPKPALRYQLLPQVSELSPGNPYQGYIKCFMEQRNFYFSKAGVALRTEILSLPLVELPKKHAVYLGNLRYADWAARLDTLDWQLTERIHKEGLDFQAGELPALRALASALQARLRTLVAYKKFPEAIDGAKTMFKLARDLGEYPAPEANLFGISIVHLALDTFEEMLQQTGCPNLYWALTDLPSPLVELRKGLQGHATLVANEFKPLRSDVVMTDAELENIVSRMSGINGLAREQAGLPPKNWRAGLEARLKDKERVREAHIHFLDDRGDRDLYQVVILNAKIPALQIILLDEKRCYNAQLGERMKLVSLALWQSDACSAPKAQDDGLFADLLPNVLALRRAQARLEQRLALLRSIEALRLSAADHAGKLPEELAALPVPLPNDPITGKPFVYELKDSVAHLRGSPPRGEEKNPEFNLRYEVTIKK